MAPLWYLWEILNQVHVYYQYSKMHLQHLCVNFMHPMTICCNGRRGIFTLNMWNPNSTLGWRQQCWVLGEETYSSQCVQLCIHQNCLHWFIKVPGLPIWSLWNQTKGKTMVSLDLSSWTLYQTLSILLVQHWILQMNSEIIAVLFFCEACTYMVIDSF